MGVQGRRLYASGISSVGPVQISRADRRSASEHIFADSRVIIRENEPTSIIAFTLSSKTYRDKVRHYNLNAKSGKVEAFMPDDGATERSSMWDIVSLDEAVETDDGSSRKEGGTHLKYGTSSTLACAMSADVRF